MTIPRSDRVSTENGWKSVRLENVNCVNLNRFQLKRLIPIEHDLKVHLNPNYFFRLNKSLHLFEMHFAFLNLILSFL